MDFKEVCCNIRSCLNSSKSQLSLTQLTRDYHEVLGESIPFRSLGFNSVESLIRAVPNLRISSIRGELFIDVKPDEKTAHIASLVREQRCAKKKRKKPSRGFYRGGAPPPRRPVTMPPPRRSAPPPRSSEYYPSRRRDSPPQPPQQSYSYQNQRRPSPPRRPERDDHYQRRKDSPPYQNYRNSAPIEVSSDEDNGCNYNNRRASNLADDVRRKYCSQPSQYDFSDPNEYNDEGASDIEDCEEINTRMEELKVTLGKDRQVSINKPKLRSYPSNTSNEDDFGYSSMKTSRQNGVDDRTRPYYQTISSDSYEYDDDDDDYTSSTTTTTTTTDNPGSGDRYSSAPLASSNRRPFGNRNRSDVYDTDDYSTNAYPKRSSRGRGYLLENAKPLPSSTSSIMDPKKVLENEQRNIKVTVPNGSGRARVVAFLLR